MIDELKKIAFEKTNEYFKEAFDLNLFLANNPEISGEEYEACEKISKILESHECIVERNFQGFETAFIAKPKSGNRSRKIAILTEYDALPEIGHACGHSLSGAISVLAGLSLMDTRIMDAMDADIHIIGTPIEETDGAKCQMVNDGIFKNYDMAMMVHLYNHNFADVTLNCLDSHSFTFHGKSAHASAAPWDGINALNGAQLMMHAVDMLRQHVKSDVRIHGIYRDGGAAPNIVPEVASIEMYSRSLKRAYLNQINEKIFNCANGAALATGTTVEIKPTANPYDNMNTNSVGVKIIKESFEELGIVESSVDLIFGSSDIGNVSYACPTFQPTIKVSNDDIFIHTREFEETMRGEDAKRALEEGAKVLILQALKVFTNESVFKEMKTEFENSII